MELQHQSIVQILHLILNYLAWSRENTLSFLHSSMVPHHPRIVSEKGTMSVLILLTNLYVSSPISAWNPRIFADTIFRGECHKTREAEARKCERHTDRLGAAQPTCAGWESVAVREHSLMQLKFPDSSASKPLSTAVGSGRQFFPGSFVRCESVPWLNRTLVDAGTPLGSGLCDGKQDICRIPPLSLLQARAENSVARSGCWVLPNKLLFPWRWRGGIGCRFPWLCGLLRAWFSRCPVASGLGKEVQMKCFRL